MRGVFAEFFLAWAAGERKNISWVLTYVIFIIYVDFLGID
jgi:hypothetical protein